MKRFIFNDYSDAKGYGEEKLFNTRKEALKAAEREWGYLTRKEQKERTWFYVAKVELTEEELKAYEEQELELPIQEYETEIVKDFLEGDPDPLEMIEELVEAANDRMHADGNYIDTIHSKDDLMNELDSDEFEEILENPNVSHSDKYIVFNENDRPHSLDTDELIQTCQAIIEGRANYQGGTAEGEPGVTKWYAVLRDNEDIDWSYGSFNLFEAKKMLEEFPDGLIAVLDVTGAHKDDPFCLAEIRKEDL